MLRFTLILFLLGQIICAQELATTKIDSILQRFHANKSVALHIHSNKSTYVSDEKIWFSIYAFEKVSAKINKNKYNVVVQLTDSNNTILSKSLLYLNNGQVNGNFTLNPEIKTDTYYLKTFIPKNATPSAAFTKAIKIINPSSSIRTKNKVNHITKLDVQILPEGGCLISNTLNSCGIKILNANGKGVRLKNLVLEDIEGNILKNNVATNALGMGKFSFMPEENITYFLRSKSKNFKHKLPRTSQIGIALKLEQNYKTGELQIDLNTNERSLAAYSNQDFIITIHKAGLARSYITQFDEDYPKLVLNIPSHKLFSGTNTITVFNKDLKPMVERLFFNFESVKETSSFIHEASKVSDTVTYTILNKVGGQTVKTQTSISVLPLKTLANTNRDHVFASVHLKPFLNGNIENPSYYFQKNNNKKRYELDLLLLTQGWSKYNWNTIFNAEKDSELENNSGLTISGYVVPFDEKQKLKNVLLYSKTNKNIKMVDLDKDNTFHIENLILQTDSDFEFSTLDNFGKPVKANFFFTVKPLGEVLDKKFEMNITDSFSETSLTEAIIENFEGEVLDEVIINVNKLKFKRFTKGRYGVKVDSSLYAYRTVEDYFKSKEGLRLAYHFSSGSDFGGYYWTYRDGTKAHFILNGKRATYMNGLLKINMENILELYHGGRDGYGHRNSHLIYTNGKELEMPEYLKTSKTFKLKNGFTFQKETYKPEYIDYESDSYQKFAAIAWEPLVKSNKDSYSKISFINPGKHSLLFYIEGFTETGEPFSTITSYERKKN